MNTSQKLLVLTSGGDSPGMNAAIRAVVRTCHHFGAQIYGCQFGYQGLIDLKIFPLLPETVANCIQLGGTILKADRCMSFFEKKIRAGAAEFLKSERFTGLIVIGGNGSFKGASLFAEESGLSVIGVPGTIDNDITGTDYTVGFDTARNTALHAIDRIRDTASSHNHNFLIEVMGRSSGFLAVDVGIAGGAEIIMIPEFEIPIEKIAERLSTTRRIKLSSIIVVAEGSQPGRSLSIAKQLQDLTGTPFKVCILGHTQRGGSPTLLDRKIASQMGYLAAKTLSENKDDHLKAMTALRDNQIYLTALPELDSKPRQVTDTDLIMMNDILCA